MKAFTGIVLACALAVSAAVVAAAGGGQAVKIADGDWPNYNRDLAATRYSPLTQINTSNVGTLKQVWTMPGAGSEVVPLVLNGVMYFPAGRQIMAVDGATGKEVWHYDLTPAPPQPGAAPQAGRGGRQGRG